MGQACRGAESRDQRKILWSLYMVQGQVGPRSGPRAPAHGPRLTSLLRRECGVPWSLGTQGPWPRIDWGCHSRAGVDS